METLAVAVAVSIVTWLLARAAKPFGRVERDETILEYGRLFKGLAIGTWVLGGVAILLALKADPSERVLAYVFVPVFVAMALYLHLEVFGVRIAFNAETIRATSPWRRSREIPWGAITGVTFSRLAQWYVIETNGYGRVSLHLYLSGRGSLLAEAARRGFEIPESVHA